jgi:hypothetical protein
MCDDVQLCNRRIREFLILARTWFAFGLPSKTGCDICLDCPAVYQSDWQTYWQVWPGAVQPPPRAVELVLVSLTRLCSSLPVILADRLSVRPGAVQLVLHSKICPTASFEAPTYIYSLLPLSPHKSTTWTPFLTWETPPTLSHTSLASPISNLWREIFEWVWELRFLCFISKSFFLFSIRALVLHRVLCGFITLGASSS